MRVLKGLKYFEFSIERKYPLAKAFIVITACKTRLHSFDIVLCLYIANS